MFTSSTLSAVWKPVAAAPTLLFLVALPIPERAQRLHSLLSVWVLRNLTDLEAAMIAGQMCGTLLRDKS